MVIDIKMCRFENVPWGFRLVGGSDFEYPLTVVKVTEGSIAEEAGLRVGDVIVRINDAAASPLTHDEANQIIKHCGNVFYFGIYREHEESEDMLKCFPINEPVQQCESTMESLLETMPSSPSYCKSPISLEHVLNSNGLVTEANERDEQLSERTDSVMSENTEIKLVEEEIAAVLSGESEVLKEHNVLGIFPKPGVCMSSDVLRNLNEEAIKTKAEKDLEKKKWTTFLQKPDRPIPKSKQQLEAERRAANAYKVQIVKSSPRTPERAISPSIAEGVSLAPINEDAREPDFTITAIEKTKRSEPEVEKPTVTDAEIPNLEEMEETVENELENPNQIEKDDEEEEVCYENAVEENAVISEQKLSDCLDVVDDNLEAEQEESVKTIAEKSAEEIALERQLVDVQKQLEALSTLPSTIQATLDAVTKQLAVLLPTFKLQQQQQQQQQQPQIQQLEDQEQTNLESNNEVRHVCLEMGSEDEEFSTQKCEETDENDAVSAGEMVKTECQSALNAESHTNGLGVGIETTMDSAKEPQMQPAGTELTKKDENQMKKQKIKSYVIEELEEHLERKSNPRRSKRLFGPLTPSSERPLVLPGGRRWYRPKDAFNDEFIAETLSAQAELITGTTLGGVYESSLLPFDPRVNFMKYQKPEKKIDLNRSEVYKVIHHLDRQPVRGIEVRPPIVPAEVDIRKAVQSV